jgi:serine/threonine protein kinase
VIALPNGSAETDTDRKLLFAGPAEWGAPRQAARRSQFKIQSLLGKGGMGDVFSAIDTRLNRNVALKILPGDFAEDPQRLNRFEFEAKSLAGLNHPNVLSIFEVGRSDSTAYLVSELLEGKTLREEANNAPLPVRKATDYALQIARGLAAANAKGLIHRDLKPENIFITKEGRVKILDFGLAKLNSRSEISNLRSQTDPDSATLVQSTVPGLILGTPAYMAPEPVRGEPMDHRSDIFAFGCTFYELLSGAQAYGRKSLVESMNAILIECHRPIHRAGRGFKRLRVRRVYRLDLLWIDHPYRAGDTNHLEHGFLAKFNQSGSFHWAPD